MQEMPRNWKGKTCLPDETAATIDNSHLQGEVSTCFSLLSFSETDIAHEETDSQHKFVKEWINLYPFRNLKEHLFNDSVSVTMYKDTT